MKKIDFTVETEYGVYRDALYLSDEQVEVLSEQDIGDMKQLRVDNWIAIITAPPIEPPEEVDEISFVEPIIEVDQPDAQEADESSSE
jgi:hypothetical protein